MVRISGLLEAHAFLHRWFLQMYGLSLVCIRRCLARLEDCRFYEYLILEGSDGLSMTYV